MTKLALIRHGHTAWNRAGRIQGRTDIALDDKARAELSGYKLPTDWNAADVVSSPLLRARDTAELISGTQPDIIEALIEMNWGDWEGMTGIDLKADPNSGFRDIEHWGWDYCPPNGESPRDVWNRIEPWVENLTTNTIAVCHIGIMRMIMAKASGWDFDCPAPFKIKRNRLYVLDLSDGISLSDADPVRLEKR